jgi:hypothetical protein
VALVREKEIEDVATEKTKTADTAETAKTVETVETTETTVLYLIDVLNRGDQIKKGLE